MDDTTSFDVTPSSAIRTAIIGTHIIDGTGGPGFHGDIVLASGTIDAVQATGAFFDDGATNVVDGTGLVTCPGFIDMFGPSETALRLDPGRESALIRGVTTEVLGLDTSRWPLQCNEPRTPGHAPDDCSDQIISSGGTNIAYFDSPETDSAHAAGIATEASTSNRPAIAAPSRSSLGSHGLLASLLPAWALSGQPHHVLARLQDENAVSRIRAELETAENTGWDEIIISTVESGCLAMLVGQPLKQIAAIQSSDPLTTLLRILREDSLSTKMLSGSWPEEDLRSADGPPAETNAAELLDLPFLIHQMTGLPASILGLANRGELITGNAADVLVFNPDAIIDKAAFADPRQPGAGTSHVFVNGVPAVSAHRPTSALAGRSLRPGAEGTTQPHEHTGNDRAAPQG